MSAIVINLRRARKAVRRREREQQATAARARSGQSRADRDVAEKEMQLEARRLENAKLPSSPPEPHKKAPDREA